MRSIPRSAEECAGGECSDLLPAGALFTGVSGCGSFHVESVHGVRSWICWGKGFFSCSVFFLFLRTFSLQYLP